MRIKRIGLLLLPLALLPLLAGCRGPQTAVPPSSPEPTLAVSPPLSEEGPAAGPTQAVSPGPDAAASALPAPGPLLAARFGTTVGGVQSGAEAVRRFVREAMTGPSGVYTNYLDTEQSAEQATGHEVLSESASLSLRIAARSGDAAGFAAAWQTAKATFDRAWGFSYRYSPKLGKAYSVNAAVDDLRLIRALYEAGEAFEDRSYTREADRYGERLLRYNAPNGELRDFYDGAAGLANGFLTLCYADFRTLLRLPETAGPKAVAAAALTTVENGYLSDRFPFYETRYVYGEKQYRSERINTVESLLTVLHLTEIGREREASIRFIRERVADGTLYGAYSREGEPLSKVESTAIYALTALIGAERKDEELYRNSLNRMKAFQIEDPASPLNGAFGNEPTQEAYSFDNLMALLAYTY